MSYLKSFLLSIYVIINPVYWIMNYQYSRQWDNFIKASLKDPMITNIDQYSCKLNGAYIWTGNYPYAYGNPCPEGNRPSRKTIYLLNKAVERAFIEELKKKDNRPILKVVK